MTDATSPYTLSSDVTSTAMPTGHIPPIPQDAGGEPAAPAPPAPAWVGPVPPLGGTGVGGVPLGTADPDDVFEADGVAAPPGGLWQRMKADPQYAPEYIALEAVRQLGPLAHDWVSQMRRLHPGIHPDVLADLAIKRFTNHARLSGAVSGVTGLPGAVVDVGVLAWTQARMVLHVAAAYRIDPTHPDRAADLLVLQRVHKVAETARLALGVAAGRERAAVLFARAGNVPVSQVMLRLGMKLAQMAGIRVAKRMFAKVVPGASIILGTWANSKATTELAVRTVALYRRTDPPAIASSPAIAPPGMVPSPRTEHSPAIATPPAWTPPAWTPPAAP